MICEIICVGTEILLGNIVNTNAKYLSEKCAEFGLSLFYQEVVGDNPERLEETVKLALSRSDVVIFSGGLGPTTDDLTKETVSKAFGLKLVEDKRARAELEERMNRFGHKMTDNNYKQAMVPEGQRALYNHNGTAPGILIEKNGKTAILLPGPPKELIPMFEEYCVPYFKSKSKETIYSIMVKMIGIGESAAAARINDIILNNTNPTVAPYAKQTQVHLRITAKGKNEDECKQLIDPVYKQIEDELGKYIYTTDESLDIEDVVVRKLIDNKLTISCAESLTGGMIASRIINVDGASECIKESYITYSDQSKINLLGVSEHTIEQYGAVSSECAKEMAENAAARSKSDIGVSATGFAGPTGEKVGLVYVGVYYKGNTYVEEFQFGNSRNMVREGTTIRALAMVNKLLDN